METVLHKKGSEARQTLHWKRFWHYPGF